MASTYSSSDTQKRFGNLINKATAFVQANISAIGVEFNDPSASFENTPRKEIRVLDYACGPGTVTNMLIGRATEFVGIDLSPNMVKEYNNRFTPSSNQDKSQSASTERVNARAYVGNLTSAADPAESFSDPRFFNFDLVAIGFGFHHFDNLPLTTARLVERLKPGGILMILDFKPHAKEDLKGDVGNTITHHGFDEEAVRKIFEGAGLVDFYSVDMNEAVLLFNNATRYPFMARARKPE